MELLQRARDSGRVIPSLVTVDNSTIEADGFGPDLLSLLDGTGFHLSPAKTTGDGFAELLKKAESINQIPASVGDEDTRKRALILRRSMLLAVAGGTPPDSPSMSQALARGYLDSVKRWLDDVLDGSIGSVDLLLHLLSNIVHLPVTKAVVKSSGMGKAIGQIEKHPICVGTANESAISERVQQVKDAWNASVKQRRSQDAPPTSLALTPPPPSGVAAVPAATTPYVRPLSGLSKRAAAERDALSPASAAKRVKTAPSSFSTLLMKVSGPNGIAPSKAIGAEAASPSKAATAKKSLKRVKWADHFGGDLSESQLIEGDASASKASGGDGSVSWSDRKKRDRMREKELLSKVKKSKLMDDDDDDDLTQQPKSIVIHKAWHDPAALPDRPDVAKAELSSSEVVSLNERMAAVLKAVYRSEYEVPSSPTPLSDVEQALDMTSQASSVVQSIPFFVPQVALPAQAAATAYQPAPSATLPQGSAAAYAPLSAHVPIGGSNSGATLEFVQALGLPLFLVGQDVQALQTLASSPSLLSTLVDQNGMYDQARLMTLVQTLSGSVAAQAVYPQTHAPGLYGPGSVPATPAMGQLSSTSFPMRNGFRSNNPDGNLHISGYGPTTTEQDIINLFAPYVIVDEVVMKGNFAFVNTNDPENAQKAREALTGSYLGGMPVRINPAQRKPRDAVVTTAGFGGVTNPTFGGVPSSTFSSAPSSNYSGTAVQPQLSFPTPPVLGIPQTTFTGIPPPGPSNGLPTRSPAMHQAVPLPPGIPNVDAVRDDRGNPATKNLFVAGYGHGTTEQQIREIFGKHVAVVGVVLKGSFTFVNTADRTAAVVAREALSGVHLNGGALRINFAKETGRLGTSFDLTYGPNTGPNARRGPPGPPGPAPSYYGR